MITAPDRRSALLAFALYGLLVLVSFYPQSVRPADTVAYVGDSLESVYIVAWNARQLFRAPAHLFDANVLHPHPRALAFTDHRLLPSVLVAPVIWVTGNPVLATNVAIALACLLAAGGARHLARSLGTGEVAAWTAGALYAFHTYQVNEAPRLNIVFHGFIPFALGELIRLLTTGEMKHAWRTAGFLLLQGWSSNYHLLYGALLLGFVALAALVAGPVLTGRRLLRLLLPAACAAVLFAPIALPYLAAARVQGYVRDLPAGVDLRHYLSTSPTNLVYGARGAEVRLQQRGPHFVGFVSLALAGLALAAALVRRSGEGRTEAGDSVPPLLPVRAWVLSAAALAVVFVVLSLGKDLVVFGHALGPGPYRLLHRFVPGFQLVRIPERLGLIAILFVALLVARGIALVQEAGLKAVAFVLAGLVPLEHVSPLPLAQRVPVGGHIPEVYSWLARNPTAAVAELPVRGEGLVREETLEMYFSAYHRKPIIHGYTAYPPLLTRLLRRMAAEFPAEASLQAFERVGVDTVVLHRGRTLATDLWRQLLDRRETAKFPVLERQARLDLYDRLPAAVAGGRLRLEARFAGEGAPLFESMGDEVYRLLPATKPLEVAPFPSGRRLRGPGWRYRTKAGDPAPAADDDPTTAWVVARPLRGDEFYEVQFDRPLSVSGLVLRLRRDSAFPTRFRVGGRDPRGSWATVARYDDGHALQLLERLRADPRDAALGFDLGGRILTGLSLMVEEGGTSFEGWSLPEVEVWVP